MADDPGRVVTSGAGAAGLVFEEWVAALERRHLADLTFAEVARALRALSATYVERRGRLRKGAALAGAGKRAAFALFYAPLHHLLVREIVRALDVAPQRAREDGPPATVVDLGCGTGAAGAAVALAHARSCSVVGIDRNAWALGEAAETYRRFGLRSRTRQADLAASRWPAPRATLVAAFAVNELDGAARDVVLQRLLERHAAGDAVLVVEPIARRAAPWWNPWQAACLAAGGRADEWRFRCERPPIVARLDRAAGLDHLEVTGRSLWLASR
jgi:SAM-dependent methyltransferase